MKIRTGFVSNSSSSSFVVKGFILPRESIDFTALVNKLLEKYPQLEDDYMRGLKEEEDFDECDYHWCLFSNMRKLGVFATDCEEDGAPYNTVLIGELLQDTEYDFHDMVIDCVVEGKLLEIKELIESISNQPLDCKVVVGTRMC